MNAPKEEPNSAASEAAKQATQEIRAVLDRYVSGETELNRELCKVGVKYGLGSGEFADYLCLARLEKSRASELACILGNPSVCTQFVAGEITRREALDMARDAKVDAVQKRSSRLLKAWGACGESWADELLEGQWRVTRDQGVHARFTRVDGAVLEILPLAVAAINS